MRRGCVTSGCALLLPGVCLCTGLHCGVHKKPIIPYGGASILRGGAVRRVYSSEQRPSLVDGRERRENARRRWTTRLQSSALASHSCISLRRRSLKLVTSSFTPSGSLKKVA